MKYIPKIIDENGHYGEMLVELDQCPICNRHMIEEPRSSEPFPPYWELTFQAQCKAAGWILQSEVMVDSSYICQECADQGLATFLCALCGMRQPTNQIQEEFGDPAEFLCKDCYETKPAKVWNDTSHELNEKHRWDFQ